MLSQSRSYVGEFEIEVRQRKLKVHQEEQVWLQQADLTERRLTEGQ